jgi:hypothetical protein
MRIHMAIYIMTKERADLLRARVLGTSPGDALNVDRIHGWLICYLLFGRTPERQSGKSTTKEKGKKKRN